MASRFPVVSILTTDRYEERLVKLAPATVPVYVVPFG